MNADAERTLMNLNVIAAVSQNDKLMTNEDQFDIYTPTTMRAVLRTWYGERRLQNIQRVRTTIRSAMSFASTYLDDANALMTDVTQGESVRIRTDTCVLHHVRMCEALRRSTRGLTNMLQTYRDDAAVASQLSSLAQEVTDFLSVIEPYSRSVRGRSSPPPALPPFSPGNSCGSVEPS